MTSFRKGLKIPLFETYITRRKILENLDTEAGVSMVLITKILKEEGYDNTKILKIKNYMTPDENMMVSLEEFTDSLISMGMNQDIIGDIISKMVSDEENVIYVEQNGKFYKFDVYEWSNVVADIVNNGENFNPAEIKKDITKPEHIYKASGDGKYYSSIPNIIVYNTTNWTIKNFKSLMDNDFVMTEDNI
jgi:hypothetical protein